MPQTGYTPIQLYRSATASAAPSAGDLTDGELAINTNDGKLYYKNSGGSVAVLADSTLPGTGTVTSVGGTGTVNGISLSGTVTTSGDLTLGGALTGVDLTSQVTGTLPIGNGGTNATTAPAARTSLGADAYPIQKGVNYTALVGDNIVVTAGSITITLPASPSAGDTVGIKDGTGAAATTTFTVARNGSNIASSATDLVFDKNFAEITMMYIDATIGWSV